MLLLQLFNNHSIILFRTTTKKSEKCEYLKQTITETQQKDSRSLQYWLSLVDCVLNFGKSPKPARLVTAVGEQ